MAEQTLHIGRKISHIHEFRGMNHEALSAALGVSNEGIKKFNEEAIFNIIGNN